MEGRTEVFFWGRGTSRNRISGLPEFQLFRWGRGVGEKAELCRNNYCVCIKPFELSLPVNPNTYILLVEEKKVLRKNHARFSKKNVGFWWVA